MARIIEISDSGGIFVPGTTSEEILKRGNEWAAPRAEKVITDPAKVRVQWFRVNPCNPQNCYDGGGHCGHWEPTREQTRGGFRGAIVELGYAPELDEDPR